MARVAAHAFAKQTVDQHARVAESDQQPLVGEIRDLNVALFGFLPNGRTGERGNRDVRG